MNLPNRLTLLRIILVPVFVALFFIDIPGFPYLKFFALGVFIIASLTDMLDGKIARKYNMVTEVGNFLDTIADKMMITCAMVIAAVSFTVHSTQNSFEGNVWFGAAPTVNLAYIFVVVIAVCVMINICRDLMISALKMIASSKGVKISADKLGKIKMALQAVSLMILMLCLGLDDVYAYSPGEILGNVTAAIFLAGFALLVVASVMALVSGINYTVKYRYVFKEEKD
ncbi:MAG: CDP-alcohol phosphatidyltransferase family protein [Firmicutes bacterium]|nr:CDP-alcohol phosphatidyltransferase family protein [Bacillota bacterium]